MALSVSFWQDCREHRSAASWSMTSHLTCRGRDFHELARISVRRPLDFVSLEEAETYIREVLAPFGDLPDEHWAHLTQHSVAWHAERGRFVMLCDPQIVKAFRNPWQYSLDLWKYWMAIKLPTLVIRGAEFGSADGRSRREDGAAQPVRQNPCDRRLRSRAALDESGPDQAGFGLSGGPKSLNAGRPNFRAFCWHSSSDGWQDQHNSASILPRFFSKGAAACSTTAGV